MAGTATRVLQDRDAVMADPATEMQASAVKSMHQQTHGALATLLAC